MTKNVRKRFFATLITSLMVVCYSNTALAANEIKAIECDYEIISTSEDEGIVPYNTTIKSFQGTYTGWLDIPFTVTDSSRPVKVLYAIRMQDGTTAVTHLGVRKSSASLWFWTKLNLSGNKQIQEIGKLQPGDYVLRIKTKSITDTYTIAGEIYYFG